MLEAPVAVGYRLIRPANSEDYPNKHYTQGIERPATKVAGYANEARLRGLAWVVGMMVIL